MSGNEAECLADATSRDPTCNAFAPGQQPEFFLNRSASPFRHESNIGTGSIAIVEAVADKFTNERFALKTYRRFWGRQLEDIKHIFENEVKIMKRLSSHVHMVEIRRYCMIGQQMSILLSPVASNGDLGAYLNMVLESGMSIEQESLLDCAFGCLISGLAYMHKHTIRHKDIKPQNILVHEGRVLYADFGIAFEADQSNTTTTGLAGICSRRYCAPEVQANTSRNRKSDIWSLGCVFVEMLDVLEQETELRENDQLPYCEEHKIEEVRRKLLHSDVTRRARKELFRICYDMLEPNQVHRIDSNSALRRIVRLGDLKEDPATRLICDDCLATGDCRDIASLEEMAVDFAASSLNADPATDIALSQTEIRASLNADPATNIASSQIEIRTSLNVDPPIDNTSSQTEIRASLHADPAINSTSSQTEIRTSLNADAATDIASSRTKVKSITNNDENQRKKERTVPNMLFDNENEHAMSPKAVYPGISRYYCNICGELGHNSSDCPNECWACGEAYHKSADCPNKCWNCDVAGHYARDCPNDCDACGQTGHLTDDCPNKCWTCGEVGHFARDCQDRCFVCGMLGHDTKKCRGKCHKCGMIGHWKRDCDDACSECGQLGHVGAYCPNRKKTKRHRRACHKCGAHNHRADECFNKQQVSRAKLDHIPQGPYLSRPRQRN